MLSLATVHGIRFLQGRRSSKLKDVLMSGHEVHPLTGTSEIQPHRVPHVDAEKRVFCGFQHQAQRRQYRVVMAPGDAPRMRPARMLSEILNPKVTKTHTTTQIPMVLLSSRTHPVDEDSLQLAQTTRSAYSRQTPTLSRLIYTTVQMAALRWSLLYVLSTEQGSLHE